MSFKIFPRRFCTLKGEPVYSKGEKNIADFLYKSNIKYKYEAPIRLDGIDYKPDFFLPDYLIYIEYLGMINKPEYAYQAQLKKIAYYKHHLDVIYIIPQHFNYIETIINQWIQYKTGKIPQTTYIRLCKEYVPQAPTKEWLNSKKGTFLTSQLSTAKTKYHVINSFFLFLKHIFRIPQINR